MGAPQRAQEDRIRTRPPQPAWVARRRRLAAVAGAQGGQAGQDGGQVAALVGEVVGAGLGGPLDHALLLEQA
jgi:hypothetical protein